MKRNWSAGAILALVVCGAVSLAVAGEHPGVPLESKATPVNTTSTAPSTMSFQGSISDLDLQTNSLKLMGQDGKAVTLSIDPKVTLVWKGAQTMSLADLKPGEQVKVNYVAQGEKRLAKAIDIQ